MASILALDQGTTSSRCIEFNHLAQSISQAQLPFEQLYPHPGWVEHDPLTIWDTQYKTLQTVLSQALSKNTDIAALGITNQRETTLIWDRATSQPVYNAIVWQDRRTADYCKQLISQGYEALVTEKTGLLLDPYFSATKIGWILNHIDGVRQKAEQGQLAFGTIDTWLIWNLTQGKLHITDVTNASRTLLFNIDSLQWDTDLLELFNIPVSLLPEVKSSSEHYGVTNHPALEPDIPICGIAGDQQAALFGQQCWTPGMTKCTYGTGSFLVMNSGNTRTVSKHRLLSTIAWQIDNTTTYALEGSVFTSGALIQWLRDGLNLFKDASDSEALANSVDDNGGVVIVPALTGLGAPYWDPNACGAIFGLSRGTTSAHLCRAALESICLQVDDILSTMRQDADISINELRIDGGAVSNNLLVQLQADISSLTISRPTVLESTALGAAYLAGLASGIWTQQQLSELWLENRRFYCQQPSEQMNHLKSTWHKAVNRSLNWSDDQI